MLKIRKVLRFNTKLSIKQYFLDILVFKHDIYRAFVPLNLYNVSRPRLKSDSLVFTLRP